MNAFWIVLGIVTLAVASLLARLRASRLRRTGLLPAADQATLADVGRLVAAGEKAYAVGCYKEI